MSSLQSWVSEHKLTSVGTLWASAIGASLLYTTHKRSPFKPSLRIIHARMHAQAVTLAVLSGAAAMHYIDLNYDVVPQEVISTSSVDAHERFEPISNW